MSPAALRRATLALNLTFHACLYLGFRGEWWSVALLACVGGIQAAWVIVYGTEEGD